MPTDHLGRDVRVSTGVLPGDTCGGFSLLASGSPTASLPGLLGGRAALELLRRAVSRGLLCQRSPAGPCLLAGGAGLAPICHALMSRGLKVGKS